MPICTQRADGHCKRSSPKEKKRGSAEVLLYGVVVGVGVNVASQDLMASAYVIRDCSLARDGVCTISF